LHCVTEKVTIVTDMITRPSSYNLPPILFGKTRQAVLSLLYSHTDEAFYLRQIARATGAGLGPVQREMKQLVDAGIISRTIQGKQAFYQANPDSPIFAELKSLIDKMSQQNKAVGYVISGSDAKADDRRMEARIHIPKDKLADFCGRHRIRRLSLFGSVLRDDFGLDSDIDVLVEFEPGYVPGFGFVRIRDELSEMLARNVDLRTPQDLSHYFREQVIREARALYVSG